MDYVEDSQSIQDFCWRFAMNIILGVTGSVAATLTLKMVKALQEIGTVQVVMTEHGKYFQDLDVSFRHSGIPVWKDNDEWWFRKPDMSNMKVWQNKGDPIQHINLSKWGGVLVIAPLSANTMAKMINGICDNLLTSLYRAWDRTRPVIVAPAMNTMMWEHPVTKKHVRKLIKWGVDVIGPDAGMLSCGDEGIGAMARIEHIATATKNSLRWLFPLAHGPNGYGDCSGLPIGTHPGAFGTNRRLSRHTGVDLYCKEGTVVRAVEDGRVVGWEPFTGEKAGSTWWMDTDALLIEGASGVVCYGEIKVDDTIVNGHTRVVHQGDFLGNVRPVVKKGRERPDIPGHSRSMLHVELYERARRKTSTRWELGKDKHDYILDSTPWLAESVGCPPQRLDMPSWPDVCKCDKHS
jgi:phosphopantothenoylcysteine decarboxylase